MIPMPKRNTVEDAAAIVASTRLRDALLRTNPAVPLGELGKVTSGSTPRTNDPSNWGGDIVWITPKDLGRPRYVEVSTSERTITESAWPNLESKLLPVGTVLFSSRAPIGHVGIADVPLCSNQGFKNIVCSDQLEHRFLFHMLRGAIREVESQGRGNTFHEVPANVVKRIPIPLLPSEQQTELAAALDGFYLRLAGAESAQTDTANLASLGEQRESVELAESVVELHRLHTEIGTRLSSLLPALLRDA